MPPFASPASPSTPLPTIDAASETTPAFSPLYQQIKTLIMRGLQSGEWKPGEAIPSELELAGRFRVSQGTVRKAIDELAAENLLVRRQGKGTFVATHSEEKIQYRFLRLQPEGGGEPGPMQRQFLDCRRIPAPADVAKALSLRPGEMAVEIRRTLSQHGRAIVLDDIWLPAQLFTGLTAQRMGDYRGPLYGLFESEFGVRMIRAEEKIRAVAADPEVAGVLGIEVGSPLLSVERLSLTYGDKPVELRRGFYNTSTHHYRNELS
jgi:GntR family transcriptional regulator